MGPLSVNYIKKEKMREDLKMKKEDGWAGGGAGMCLHSGPPGWYSYLAWTAERK